MDTGNSSGLVPVRGPGKRSRSPDAEHGFPESMPVPEASHSYPLDDAFGFDNKPKRRRLSSAGQASSTVVLEGRNFTHNPPSLTDMRPDILQHIFTFLDPVTLGRLICVNRSFRLLLDSACTLPQALAPSQQKQLPMRSRDSIWKISRRTFLPGFPKPMDGMTELDMWRLVRGRSCQYSCGKQSTHSESISASDPWRGGPGLDNVRSIWPLRVRSCGPCLKSRLIEDGELAFSSNSALRAGLPFIFLTHDLNYVLPSTLQSKASFLRVDLTKYYFIPQLEELVSNYQQVHALGDGPLKEWSKGLETAAKKQLTDAARFEQWELYGGPTRLSMLLDRSETALLPSSGPDITQEYPLPGMNRDEQVGTRSAAATPSSSHRPHQPSQAGSFSHVPDSHATTDRLSYSLTHMTGGADNPSVCQSFSNHKVLPHPHRNGRSHREANEAKLERRREIERRCLALNPPIRPCTLVHMKAFQAAILISVPLDERQWENLKPHILTQRADAEYEEMQAALQDPFVQASDRRRIEEQQRIAQANNQTMWDGLKIPSRVKIQKFAEEFMHLRWHDGKSLTAYTAITFAAEVLSHVRQRFHEVIGQEDQMLAAKGTAFPQDPESLACRGLTLQDMKWTFLEYVQPHTQHLRKDLFLCHMCDTNQKLFAFEAIVQHFGSKHTNALGHGKSVVSWDAEWPLEPPFDKAPNVPWVLENVSIAPANQALGRPQPMHLHGASLQSGTVSMPRDAETWSRAQHRPSAPFRTMLDHQAGPVRNFVANLETFNNTAGFNRASVSRSDASWSAAGDAMNVGRYPASLQHEATQGTRLSAPSVMSDGFSYQKAHVRPPMRPISERGGLPLYEAGSRGTQWREDQPMSHGMGLYSERNSSSKFSRGETVTRARGPDSESDGHSQATSHVSHRRAKGLELGTPLSMLRTSSPSTLQADAKSNAEHFLNSFDPRGPQSEPGSGRATINPHYNEQHLSHRLGPPRFPGAPTSNYSGWNAASSPPLDYISHRSLPAPGAALPIRPHEVHISPGSISSSHAPYSPPRITTYGYTTARDLRPGSSYTEEDPQQKHRHQHAVDNRSEHDAYAAHSEPFYEPHYIYDRDGRRYEEIRDPHPGPYGFAQHAEFPDRSREVYRSDGAHFIDDIGHPARYEPRDVEHYRAGPTGYGDYDIGQPPIRARMAPVDERYGGPPPLMADDRNRVVGFGDRDIVYQPLDEPGRTRSRTLGTERP